MRRLLIFIALIAMCAPCAAHEANVEELIAQSSPPIQEQIRKILGVINQSRVDPRRNIAALRESQALTESVADHSEIVKQMAIFAAMPATREGRPLEARAVLEVIDPPPEIVIPVLAPFLNADNKNLRSFVRDWFQYHDEYGSGPSSLQCLNYHDYLEYVRGQLNRNEELPTAFIEYIYEKSPDRALLIFTQANPQQHAELIERLQEMRKNLDTRLRQENSGQTPIPPLPPPKEEKPEDKILRLERQQFKFDRREILLAEHIVGNAIWLKNNKFDEQFQKALPDAKEELAMLSEHSEWWARLYVAEIMRRHRELHLDGVLQKLSSDENALVSKAAKSAKR